MWIPKLGKLLERNESHTRVESASLFVRRIVTARADGLDLQKTRVPASQPVFRVFQERSAKILASVLSVLSVDGHAVHFGRLRKVLIE